MKKICFILIANCLLLIANCYSQPVTQEWVRRFSGFGYANGLSVKLDSSGNIYVLLKVYSDSTFNDFGLIKYSNSGNLIWSRYYNNISDSPEAFDVDKTGNVYITGTTGINFEYHILTVKINTDGFVKWAKVYDGGGPGDGSFDIKADGQGFVTVFGGSSVNNTLSVALTIKYNDTGDTLWVRKFFELGTRYSLAYRAVVDHYGNTYSIGDFEPDIMRVNYLTLKYDFNGNLIWYSIYDSPQQLGSSGYNIALDSNFNVYVIGINSVPYPGDANNTLVKIISSGEIEWARAFSGIAGIVSGCETPAGVAVLPGGNAIYYSTSCYNGNSYEIVTLKYNAVGDTQWVKRYGGGNNIFEGAAPSDIKLDNNNGIYVVGSAYFENTGIDYVTIKYNNNGTQIWVMNFNGPVYNSEDFGKSLAVDNNFNVYVTGISSRQNNPFLWDAATIKYNQPNGIISNTNKLPTQYKLYQNYPNPFNSVTVITYELPRKSNVKLTLYNITGQLVRTLVNTEQIPGYYSIAVNMDDFASGVYFYKIESGSFVDTKKLVLVK